MSNSKRKVVKININTTYAIVGSLLLAPLFYAKSVATNDTSSLSLRWTSSNGCSLCQAICI